MIFTLKLKLCTKKSYKTYIQKRKTEQPLGSKPPAGSATPIKDVRTVKSKFNFNDVDVEDARTFASTILQL